MAQLLYKIVTCVLQLICGHLVLGMNTSLTAHYTSANFVMKHKTLHCLYLPGTHNHTAIAKACIEGYHIDFNSNVTAFTTDDGSNVVKAVEEDLNCLRIPCAGHTLNLSVSARLEVDAIKTAIGRSKKVVTNLSYLSKYGTMTKMLPRASVVISVYYRFL